MVNIIRAWKLCSFYYKNTSDERSSDSSHTGLIPLWLTNQDGQLKTLQRQTTTSLIILCLCLTNRPSQLKGQTVGDDCLKQTQTNTHSKLPPSHPPTHPYTHTHTTKQTAQCAHTHTHTHTALSETNTREAHTRISPLLCLSLPDETNRTLIHKMEGKNALVYNHWLLHRLGGWIKGQSNIISWYRPLLHTNYSFKGKQEYLNLTVYQCI